MDQENLQKGEEVKNPSLNSEKHEVGLKPRMKDFIEEN